MIFDKFSAKEIENMVEHVAQFTAQCREAITDTFLKLQLFKTSLTKTDYMVHKLARQFHLRLG